MLEKHYGHTTNRRNPSSGVGDKVSPSAMRQSTNKPKHPIPTGELIHDHSG
jgi:hypothetical protein